MPIAIAINIVLGVTVQQVLKLPIYLDSIGTILVGVLAGPLAGALTGILSNLIWQYAPGIGGGTIGPFAITAGVIGLLAGAVGPARRLSLAAGLADPADRRPRSSRAVIVVVVGRPDPEQPGLHRPEHRRLPELGLQRRSRSSRILAAIMVGGFILIRRDLAGFWVALAGVMTGIVAAFVSAPISALAFGGVTGSGVDVIVAALRPGRLGRDPRLARPGPVQRPDRQDDHELRRVHHPVRACRSGSSPGSRTASESVARRAKTATSLAQRPSRPRPDRPDLTPTGPATIVLPAPPSRLLSQPEPATKLVIALCTAGLGVRPARLARPDCSPWPSSAAPSLRAHVGRAFVPFVLATIPLILSILLINTFLFPGATDTIFTIGPFKATGDRPDRRRPGLAAGRRLRPERGRVRPDHARPTTCWPTSSGGASAGGRRSSWARRSRRSRA